MSEEAFDTEQAQAILDEMAVMAAYGDIVDVPRPVSRTHAPMPREDRGAQFAPFAALSGFTDIIEDTARGH
ncbi:hypothetical protein [Denitrobacterium detoxificans]|jgi:hypothetical protein|uniref:hypothetical protein n=1 Tax=Denitrobacterium detoxificans TaxID=79604 RepID=UPI0026E95FD2|nr:hypothetical protein [Denitrobacterium detoxificans]MBE6465786.1 hypothetical protein [Denitrobacterium detoxificans]